MAVLVSCQGIAKSFGARPLFESIDLAISEGERLGVIGPNGSGKSTLLKILAGMEEPDAGIRSVRKLLRIGYVPQESRFLEGKTVGDLVPDPVIMGRAGFTDPAARVESLSGGWKRRLAIAQELAREPDVLFLDEPTNHLDIEGILWLEKLLESAPFASVIITHDRHFLENVANEVAEINRVYPDGLFRTEGSYSHFLLRREEFVEAQSKQQEALANKVRREIEWLRRGPKARTSKSKARIDAAGKLIDELADVSARNVKGTAQIDFTASDRRTKKLVEAEAISKSMGGRLLFRDLSFTLRPGARMGLLGLNGSGKTTLLRILNAEIAPDTGTVERAEGLRIVYFDQGREQLEPAMPLREAIGAQEDFVQYRGRPIHVAGWAKRFLFRAEQLDVAVGKLSGGEQARVLIARLMLQPADLLLLDEPTNDLDIPTLEVLEDSLGDFPGALVLVTHDRYMLDRVSTLVLGIEDSQFYADYWQWEQAQFSKPAPKAAREAAPQPKSAPAQRKLSYMERREWEQMEEKILAAEEELTAAQADMAKFASDSVNLPAAYERMQKAEQAVQALYSRWAELEAKQA